MKREVKMKQFRAQRDSYIIRYCTGKKVLHIGPTDWPYTERKIESDGLLYAKIDEVCAKQIGLDLDAEGVDYLNKLHFKKSEIYVQDMNEDFDFDFTPEVIIFGETMEHLMNQEVALSSLKRVMGDETDLIISVPNATYFMQFAYGLIGSEYQHPDHSAAFSYKVMRQLLGKNDLHIEEFLFTFISPSDNGYNWKGKIAFYISFPIAFLFPMFSSTLLVRARLKK